MQQNFLNSQELHYLIITPHGFSLINPFLCLTVSWALLFTVSNHFFTVLVEQYISLISRHFNIFLFKICFVPPTVLLLSSAVKKMAVKPSESFLGVLFNIPFLILLPILVVSTHWKDALNRLKMSHPRMRVFSFKASLIIRHFFLVFGVILLSDN